MFRAEPDPGDSQEDRAGGVSRTPPSNQQRVSPALSVALTCTPVTELNLPIPHSLIEQIAESIAERAFDLFAERMVSGTPWMTTDEAIAYTRIPAGTFDKLAARGRIPSHSADGGRRKLYHREELDR